jgi:hypothetical protein
MDKTKEEKKSALKLINKYAESYQILENENKQLKSEIKDLKLNLKINKEIIEGLYNLKNQGEKETLFHQKVKQEHIIKDDIINNIKKENDELRYKLNYEEQCHAEKLNFFREDNEKLKNKLFLIDNIIIKKDNMIQNLKRKIDNYYDNEIFVTEPTQILMQLNEELLMYKDLYSKLMSSLNHNKSSVSKYERIIHELQLENTKLTTELNMYHRSKLEEANKEGLDTTLKTAIRLNSQNNIDNVNKTDNTSNYKVDNILKKLNITSLSQRPVKKYYEYEEWWNDALRQSNMAERDFAKFKTVKQYSYIVDLIEFLNSIIVDKNFQTKILEQEIDHLNEKNDILNAELVKSVKRARKVNDSLDGNLSSNSVILIKKPFGNFEIKKPVGSFEIKKLNTMSSITSSEFRDGIDDNMFITDQNQSMNIDNIDININVEN